MNRHDLYKAIGEADDELLERSERKKRGRGHRKPWWAAVTAAVLVIAIAAGVIVKTGVGMEHASAEVIAEAVYPEMAPYPERDGFGFEREEDRSAYNAWREDVRAQQMQEAGYTDGLESFFSAGIRQFLSENEGENKVCSPINIYLELAMLAELTDGESRQQILELIGTDSVEALRTQAKEVWNAQYRNDGVTTSILANSLWLDEKIPVVSSALETLADNYYASSYQGTMGSRRFNRMLQDWLNEQTGGLLEKQVQETILDEQTILALISTIYYQAQWGKEFDEENTLPDTFHAISGEITCDFMHGYSVETYYGTERFEAVSWKVDNDGGIMWFLLPEEGVTVENLLHDAETMDFLLNGGDPEKRKEVILNLSVPKFDITYETELSEGLQELGVTDIFDSRVADFSPLTGQADGICVSQANHNVRVAIDEKGVSAAAYTEIIILGGGAADPEEIEMNLNRPFIFAITSHDGLPLFVGCVYEP